MRGLTRVGVVLSLAIGASAWAAPLERRPVQVRDVAPEVVADELKEESIRMLEEMLASERYKGEQRAEMMFRLAELYFQRGRAHWLEEMKRGEELLAECYALDLCDPATVPPPDHSESAAWHEKSVRLYRGILAGWPRFARADEVAFHLGSALLDLGRPDEAAEQFQGLVERWPDAPLAADAWVQLGEHRFANGDAAGAMLAYQKAARFEASALRPFALYKLAWCQYNLGDVEGAIVSATRVIRLSTPAEEGAVVQAGRIELREEALADLVRFYADLGDLERARDALVGLGEGARVKGLIATVAQSWFEQGRWETAILAWKGLISEHPTDPEAPEWQARVVAATKKLGRVEQIAEEVDRLRRTYGATSAWARANAGTPGVVKAAGETIERELRQAAVEAHDRGRRLTGDDARTNLAAAWHAYRAWLEDYGDDPHAYDVRYAYAELLYKVGRHDEAYDQYMEVVRMDPGGKHARFCAESAIFAAEAVLRAQTGAEGPPGAGPQPLSEWEQRLVDACDQYVRLFPDDAKAKGALYKAAYLLYARQQFAAAAERFREVIARDPASREAEQAAHLVLDSLAVQEDWDALADNARFYLDAPGLGSKAFKQEVRAVWERASFKRVESAFSVSGDADAAGDGYAAYAEAFPGTELAAQALHNAAVHYRQAGRGRHAIAAATELVDGAAYGPKTRFYDADLLTLAWDHEQLADFARAAALYERAREPDATWSAAVFREALGDTDAAIRDYAAFADGWPDDPRAPDARLAIARVQDAAGRHADAARSYGAIADTRDADPTVVLYARLHQGLAVLAAAEGAAAQARAHEIWRAALAAEAQRVRTDGPAPTEPAATAALAEMRFRLTGPLLARYEALQIVTAPPTASKAAQDAALERSLRGKLDAYVAAEKGLTQVVDTGDGRWGIAAIVRLGGVYEEMARALRESQVPHYLTPEQAELYPMRLEDQAWAQEEKAVAHYVVARDRGFALGLYGDDVRYAGERLSALRPDDHPPLHEQLVPPHALAGGPSTAFEVASDGSTGDAPGGQPTRRGSAGRDHQPAMK